MDFAYVGQRSPGEMKAVSWLDRPCYIVNFARRGIFDDSAMKVYNP